MNRKRKILTIVALAVFGAIIPFHYGSLGYDSGGSSIEYLTTADQTEYAQRGWKITKSPYDPYPSKSRTRMIVERQAGGFFWDNRYPGIKDIRMPLIALAALYSILFLVFGGYIDKRKILTVVALAVFGAIILLNYDGVTSLNASKRAAAKAGLNMQLLVLAVGYIGVFFLLGDKKRDSQ